MMYIYDGRTSFYQWDTNQKIVSENLKVGDEVHFFNLKQPNALVVLAYELNGEIVADVPNILLQNSYPIIVYRMYIDNNGQYTRDEYTFKVIQRAKPGNYVYTETEVLAYSKLIERLDQIEENGVSDYQIATSVEKYLEKNPVEVSDVVKTVNGIVPNEDGNVEIPVGDVSDEQISNAVADYLKDNPITGGGGLIVTDDNNGNVIVESVGSVTITDDGFGNVTIA